MIRPRLHRPSPAMVVALVALAVALSGTAYAATGGNFVLGKVNTAGHVSTLTNSAGAALTLKSGDTGVPLTLTAPSGAAPLSVNSTARVTNLNADLLDGTNAAGLTSTAVGSDQFEGPLPHTVDTFQMTGNLSLISVSGSAYSTSGGTFLEIEVLACPGAVASCTSSTSGAVGLGTGTTFTNEANSHKTISFVYPFSLPAGTYTLAVVPLVSTTTDNGDFFNLNVVSLG